MRQNVGSFTGILVHTLLYIYNIILSVCYCVQCIVSDSVNCQFYLNTIALQLVYYYTLYNNQYLLFIVLIPSSRYGVKVFGDYGCSGACADVGSPKNSIMSVDLKDGEKKPIYLLTC